MSSLDGVVELFWPNGKLKRRLSFCQGVRQGLDQMWNDQGLLVDEGSYDLEGKPNGAHRRYTQTGILVEEMVYLSSSRKNVRRWSDRGELFFEAFWEDETHYVERTLDEKTDAFQERKGVLQGKDLIFPPTYERVVAFPSEDVSVFSFEMYRTNQQILMDRFGQLGLMLPSFSYEERKQEGIRRLAVGSAQGVYVYGLGGGAPYFQLERWLHANPDRKLIFLEDDPTAFVALLHFPQTSILLKDPQVHLEWLVDRKTDSDRLSKTFPFHRVEFFKTPSKDRKKFTSLKTHLLRRTTLSCALQIDRVQGDIPFSHFLSNVKRIPSSFFANRLAHSMKGIPAIVCGAGPSLNTFIPHLKECSQSALILAGGSSIAALSSQGVPIHFGMAIDPNLEEYYRFRNSFAFDMPLLYSTRVHPSIFQTCSGPFGYMRSGSGGLLELWLEEALSLKAPILGEDLPEEAMSVTSLVIAWALFLGCNPIFLSGVDLAYVGSMHYAKGVKEEKLSSFSCLDEEKVASDRILKGKNGKGKTIMTATRWIMERATLAKMAKSSPKTRFFNTSDEGLLIPHIPFLSFSEMRSSYLTQRPNLAEKIGEGIAKASMSKDAQTRIDQKLEELHQSVLRVIGHLEVLSGLKGGSRALAELEMAEEEAFSLLFYDLKERFCSWQTLLEVVRKYEQCF